MTQHTPEPWFLGWVGESFDDGDCYVIANGCGQVCRITNKLEGLLQAPHDFTKRRTLANQEANARLLVNAPTLLSALQSLLAECSGVDFQDNGAKQRAAEAIAKATGKEEPHVAP